MRFKSVVATGALITVALVIWQAPAFAGRVADIQNTKHNFSAVRRNRRFTVVGLMSGQSDGFTVWQLQQPYVKVFPSAAV